MKTHPYFTEIPQRSFDAIVKNGYLSEVLVALLVDPLEADDVAESIYRKTETAIRLSANYHIFSATIELADFQGLPSKDAFEKLKITISQWVMTTNRADDALRVLAMWDRRFGVWCACQVARDALRFVPSGEQRQLRAIEATEAWVNGKATLDEVRSSGTAANDAANAVSHADTLYAAVYASAAAYGANVAYYAANAAACAADNDAVELIRLREVVANACLTFPG